MTDRERTHQTASIKPDADYPAPDGFEIRLLPTMKGGGLCHCTLPVGNSAAPVAHRQVEGIWYVGSGEGEVWRENVAAEETVRVRAESSLTIPPRTAFQVRNTGDSPLCVPIATMAPWPGPQEAQKAKDVSPIMAGAADYTGSESVVIET